MEKHKLLEKAMKDYPNGTTATFKRAPSVSHLSNGVFKITDLNNDGDIQVMGGQEGLACFYCEGEWADSVTHNSNAMKTTEEVQDEYAESKGFNTFYELLRDDLRSSDYHVDKVQKIYAIQCVEHALKDAADRATYMRFGKTVHINKDSILSTPIVTP